MRAFGIMAIGLALTASGAGATDVSLGPDRSVSLIEVIYEDAPSLARFRFLDKDIGPEGLQFEDVVDDMVTLCESFAVPQVTKDGRAPEQVVISISDRVVPFGEISPEATQYFDAFRIEGARCMWEQF